MAHPRDRLGRRPYRPGPGPARPGERLRREARSTHVRPESPLLPCNRQIDVLRRNLRFTSRKNSTSCLQLAMRKSGSGTSSS
jgi:hypothetical protein